MWERFRTHSKEDLDTLIRPVAAMNDQEVPSSVNKTNEDTAWSQIEEIVNEMLKSDMIGPGIAEELPKLFKRRDARLIQAYNSYQQSKRAAVEESPRTQTNNLHQQTSAPSSETLKLRSESAENANVTHRAPCTMLRRKLNRSHHLFSRPKTLLH